MFADDFRQGPQGILDPLARRKQAEGQQHWTPGHAKVVLVKIRIRKRDVRYAVRDDGNFIRRDTVNVSEHFSPVVRHNNNFPGTFDKLRKGTALLGCGICKNSVERGNDGHAGPAEKIGNVSPGGASEDPELVLHAEHIGAGEVQEIRRPLVACGIRFGNFKPHLRRVLIVAAGICDRDHRALPVGPVGV